MNTLPRPTPLLLIILDGWGISLQKAGNAVENADTPNMDNYTWHYPSSTIVASGLEVGLPPGIAGNSETGHRNIGGGSVQYQIMAYIDQAIKNRAFFKNDVLLGAIRHAKENNSNLHLMGLVSPGGVHSHINHLFSLLQLISEKKFKNKVYIHMFTDGRDTPPRSALTYLEQLNKVIEKYKVGEVASVTGRLYAMDRNKNWERTKDTFNMLTGGFDAEGAPSRELAIKQAHANNLIDETIPPTVITKGGNPIAKIDNNDAVIFFNFRPDRARQLTQAFVTPKKVGFEAKPPENIYFATLNKYDSNIPAPAAFHEIRAEYPMARAISEAGLTQLHIAETEKYAHITYYLNVGHENEFPGETHEMVQSSKTKDWSTNPEMQAAEITKRVTDYIKEDKFDVYMINFANTDMVGHTGDYDATMKACSFVDQCLGKIHQVVKEKEGAMLITADHGKAESVGKQGGDQLFTEHTTNPVPLIYVREKLKRKTPKSEVEVLRELTSPIGVLADIAPTVLDILRLEKPEPMTTGISLLHSLN